MQRIQSCDPCASAFGSSNPVSSGAPGPGSDGYSKYCSNYLIRARGMLAPHHRAIVPASVVVLMKQNQGMRAKKSSDARCASEFGSARSVSGLPGSVPRKKHQPPPGGITAPNFVKAESPTPSQTQVGGGLRFALFCSFYVGVRARSCVLVVPNPLSSRNHYICRPTMVAYIQYNVFFFSIPVFVWFCAIYSRQRPRGKTTRWLEQRTSRGLLHRYRPPPSGTLRSLVCRCRRPYHHRQKRNAADAPRA